MTLLSRLFGKPAPKPVAEPTPPPAPPKPAGPDPAVVAREEEASVEQAIAAGDLASVERWVLEGGSTRVRQTAARAITAPDQLDRLIPAVRGKDKTAYRILVARRDELLASERATRLREAEIDDALAALSRHGAKAWDAAYASTLARLGARWQAVAANATPAQQAEAAQALARGRDVVEAQQAALAAAEDRRRAEAAAQAEERAARERAALAAAEAAAAQSEQAEAHRREEQARRESDDAQVRELLGLLRQAQAAVDHGGTARAVRLRDSIRTKMPQAPTLPAWFERKLQEVEARLGELQDWRTFTVEPKRAQLVERMQALVGAEMSPEELAKQVRKLRDEWRTVNRGAGDEALPEREAFERAAQLAYEPCREHFALQAERRKENQARREELLERLAAFVVQQSGDAPDWRAMQYALVDARNEWRGYAPVDQDAVKPLQERFHALLDELKARLDAEYARNEQAKRGLIERAAALASLDDPREAVAATRDLQSAWKSVGLVPRHRDDALWAEFRGHVDAVFERSSQARASHDAALTTNEARAVALCEELERLATDDGADASVLRHGLITTHAEFETLELPRASAAKLRRRLEAATERVEDAMQRVRARAQRDARSRLFEVHAQVRAHALAAARGVTSEERESLRAAAEAAIATLDPAAKHARGVLEEQLAAGMDGTLSLDSKLNEAALRLLCVRAELLAGLDTPPEDLELRREHQMSRLVASMGRGEASAQSTSGDLVLEWLAAGPVEDAVHEALRSRFVHALESVDG